MSQMSHWACCKICILEFYLHWNELPSCDGFMLLDLNFSANFWRCYLLPGCTTWNDSNFLSHRFTIISEYLIKIRYGTNEYFLNKVGSLLLPRIPFNPIIYAPPIPPKLRLGSDVQTKEKFLLVPGSWHMQVSTTDYLVVSQGIVHYHNVKYTSIFLLSPRLN